MRSSGAGDRLTGRSSRDLLYGGPGKYSILGGTGPDGHFGETGTDTLDSRDGVSGNEDLGGGPDVDTCQADPMGNSVASCEA